MLLTNPFDDVFKAGASGLAWGRTAGLTRAAAGYLPADLLIPLGRANGVRVVAEDTADCRTREPLRRGTLIQVNF